MQVDRKCVLLGDIGATNARLALLWDGVLSPVTNFLVADFPRFADVIRAFLVEKCRSAPAQEAILAVAGPVNGGRCVLTNSPWTIDPAELSREFGFTNIDLRNDFEAVALSLPHLTAIDLFRIGYGEPVRGAPIAVLGPGTGLGVAGLVFGPQGPVVVPGEGGHATMSGTCRREDAIIEHLRAEYGHVSAERVVSGMGLENLYSAVVALDGLRAPSRTAPEITKAGLDGTCPISRAALELFCAMLGTIAGNVALMFGALGGVYIAGGIAPRMTDFMAGSEFRSRFENKGRLRSYLEAIPTSVIVNPAATFVGLQTLAQSTPGTVLPGGTPEP
ncbi:MAG: glucokinase [Xanthobacteraceae bacterium]|nr:glucokinase [Xanthobacteraceae bacterium]